MVSITTANTQIHSLPTIALVTALILANTLFVFYPGLAFANPTITTELTDKNVVEPAFIDTNPTVPTTSSNQPIPATQLKTFRQHYSATLESPDKKSLASLSKKLTNYPLYPYLEYKRLGKDLSKLDSKSYQKFVDDNFSGDDQRSPLPRRLKQRWLHYLAAKKRWKDFLANYSESMANTKLKCNQLWALYQTGDQKKAFSGAKVLWLVGNSQPKSCDKIFAEWIEDKQINEEMAWQRFWLALNKGNVSIAKYVTRFIDDKSRKGTTNTALGLHKNPAKLAMLKFDPKQPGYTTMVSHTLKRLVRTDKDLALKLWDQFSPTLNMSDEKRAALGQRLGMSLLKGFHPDSPEWLAKIDPEYQDTQLLEWRLRFHLSLQNWPKIGELLDQLPATKRFEERWRYWRARYLENNSGQNRALGIYSNLARERSFYGFMSAQRMGLNFSLNNQTLSIDAEKIDTIELIPGIVRARELFYHRQLTDARREWWSASRNFTPEQHYLGAILVRRWGWYEQAIFSAINAKQWDDLRLRFPAPHNQSVAANANRFSIDNQLIYAVARQESAFKADVKSPAGALGLMQLMPRTAKQTARTINIKYRGSNQLTNPNTNIQLGSAYLSQLLKRYKDNRVYATAAYNAGPHRVKRWLEDRGKLPIDAWIETIPFDETRQYVQNVLSYAVIYSDLLGQEKEFLKPHEAVGLSLIN